MTVLELVVLALGAAVTALRWWDVDPARPLAPLVVRAQALVPLVGPLALLLLLRALVAGAAGPAAAAGALLAVHAALALPGWWVAPGAPDGERGRVRVRVAAVNTWYGRADAAATAALVRRLDPDVLALVEVPPAALPALERAGVAAALPHRAGRAADDGVGTLVLSRWPLEEVADERLGSLPARGSAEPPEGGERTSDNPVVRLRPPGAPPVLVRAVHPYYPALRDVGPWRRQLRSLDRWAREQAAEAPAAPFVVLGDLNATADHPPLRRLLAPRGPLVLAGRRLGGGRPRTWPDVGPASALLALDHVLVHGLRVRAGGAEHVPGTDHRAVWADLEAPRAARTGTVDPGL
ncbi:endonuclease/exonuclease/phosphatase family protein [uncultured Pseudokineococcus sp.]|uniref:endonuclease/exonuclease/phosphatase family protein n=1 Tax=uncultured Pseudokineococcus sp. TaxID=1642928 RepID=UPI0026281DF6|nr:endonuclease/exonuclease/phosphatase family protein [uncultured Pseudokineococcus sp.]